VVYAFRYLMLVLITIFWGPPACLIAPLDPTGRAIMWIGRRYVGWIYRACGIRVVADRVDAIDRTRPFVIMTNHQSVLDVGALILTLPIEWRFVAKRELTWIPLFGWAVGMSQIIIDRGRHERAVASLRRAAERIRGGANVIIFPEGTRSADGILRDFKSGGFHLAVQAQVPILPATVSGSHRLTPKGSLRIESGTLKITYGTPVPTEGLGAEDVPRIKERVRAVIEEGYDAALQRGSGLRHAPTAPSV
jgi:1-acyl-sn-glycerol-3-phosphate acyltransferase